MTSRHTRTTSRRHTFLRLSLDTKRGRRRVAVVAFLFPVFYFLITFGDKPSLMIFGQVLVFGGFLGGASYQWGGAVKPFEAVKIRRAGATLFNDEYDLARRDHAHYSAYKFWRIVIVVASSAFYLLHRVLLHERFAHWYLRPIEQQILEALIVPAAMAFLVLPQAILLWTEEDLAPEDILERDTSAMPSIL